MRPGPSGYSVEKIQHSPDLVRKYFDNWHPTVIFEVVSAAIMAGFLHAADDKMRETINSELRWLYDNQVRFVGLIFHLIVSLLSMLPERRLRLKYPGLFLQCEPGPAGGLQQPPDPVAVFSPPVGLALPLGGQHRLLHPAAGLRDQLPPGRLVLTVHCLINTMWNAILNPAGYNQYLNIKNT